MAPFRIPSTTRIPMAAFATGLALVSAATAAHAAPTAQARESWRQALTKIALPAGGCFKANYPDAAWTRVACVKAPQIAYMPHHNAVNAAGQAVGDGKDYAASVTRLVSQGVGSFPSITGLTSEKNLGRSNEYSLQMNSQFFASPVCSGAANPSSCLGWEQFVYSNQNGSSAFMQYWLINWNTTCPSGGWMASGTDCYRNSAAVSVPRQALSGLADLSITASAVANGTDTLVLTTASSAYTTTGKDSVVDLASYWEQSEYNVIGNGGGSKASFNTGTAIKVKIALTDGSSTAATCASNAGTTAETNNLNLGACTGSGGSTPSIEFTESN